MKRATILALLLLASSGAAVALPVKKSPVAAGPRISTPEIQAAEQRVGQARAQRELATKQLNASKALLKAAEADVRAAEAELSALRLKAQAQGLVDETGMTPAKAPPVKLAVKDERAEAQAQAHAQSKHHAQPPQPGMVVRERIRASEENWTSQDTPSAPIPLK